MSILACLIGILTLLISVSLIIKEKEQEGYTEEELQRAKENKALKAQAEKARAEIVAIEEKSITENKAALELKKLKDRSISLQLALDEIKKGKDRTDDELQKLVENMKLETRDIEKEQPALLKLKASLLAQIKERKLQPKPESSVIIRPGGIGKDIPKNIFFVECNSTGIILRDRKDENKDLQISTAAIEKSNEFGDLCAQVKRTDDSMILFLVRRSGNRSFLWAAGTAETKFEIKTGKLPVPNEGKIDLSLFKR